MRVEERGFRSAQSLELLSVEVPGAVGVRWVLFSYEL